MRRSPSGRRWSAPTAAAECVRTASRCWVGAPDVEVVRPEGLSYKTEEARSLAARSDMAPTRGRWHVIVMEDADRLTESANNVLLKEHRGTRQPHRLVAVRTERGGSAAHRPVPLSGRRLAHPATDAVSTFLQQQGVDGDGGFRRACLHGDTSAGPVPGHHRISAQPAPRRADHAMRDLSDLASCMAAAGNIVAAAKADASRRWPNATTPRRQTCCWRWVPVRRQRVKRVTKSALKDLEDRQNARRSRTVRDELDRVLVDLLAWFRDVLVLQHEAPVELVNEEMRPDLARMADETHAADTLLRIGAIRDARQALSMNVARSWPWRPWW